MKVVAFTGAGISKESGVDTFRDKDGLWDKFSIEDVSDISGWRKDKEMVLNFYNMCRDRMSVVNFNDAHRYLYLLEKYHDVTIITQNIDNLHEKAGSTNVLHLHGELNKMRSSVDKNIVYPCNRDILIGDKCEKGSQLRPHVVWFGEIPLCIEESYKALSDCDLLLIVGTSLSIPYTLRMLGSIDEETTVIYIDPNPSDYMDSITHVRYIRESATVGMKQIYDEYCEHI